MSDINPTQNSSNKTSLTYFITYLILLNDSRKKYFRSKLIHGTVCGLHGVIIREHASRGKYR